MGFRSSTASRSLRGALAASVAALALHGTALAQDGRKAEFNIEAQPLATALLDYARQAGVEIAVTPELTRGQRAPAIKGAHDVEAALRILLRDVQGVVVRRTPRGTVIIEPETSGEPAMQRSAYEVDDIVVTARKREEDLRSVAGSVSAMSGRQLDELGAQSFADYLTRVPGIQFNDAMPGYSSISVRGVSTTTSIDVGQASTGVYINDIPLADPFNSAGIPDVDTFDVQRVEVLRGPQGTLFGSAALGGAINYIAARADMGDRAGRIEAGVADTAGAADPGYQIKGMINLPLIQDRLAVRAVATYRERAGYIDNIGVGVPDSNSMETVGGRLSVEWKPTDAVSISALSLYFESENDDAFTAFTTLPDLQRSTRLLEPFRSTAEIHSLRGDVDLGWASLTVQGAHSEKSTHNVTDFTNTFGGLLNRIPTQIPLIAERASTGDLIEARLTSNGDTDFQWLVGASYFDSRIDLPSYSEFAGAAALIESLYAGRYGAGVGQKAAPNDRFNDYFLRVNGQEKAVFGEASWRFAPSWTLTAGGRFFDTSIDHSSRQSGLLPLLSTGSPNAAPAAADASEQGFNPKVSLRYEPSDDLMVYGLVSKGFRFGGPNPIPPNPAYPSPSSFGSDALINYEVGVRASTPDRRWLVDATLYYIDWSDIQLLIVRGDNLAYADNVGSARNLGVDLALTWRPTPSFAVNSTVGYLAAELSEALPSQGVAEGAMLPGASRWRLSNTLTWRGDAAVEPMLIASHRYISDAPSNLQGTLRQGDYNLFDLRGSVTLNDARLEAYVENLTDARGVTVSQLSGGVLRHHYVRPRTIGVRVTYDF